MLVNPDAILKSMQEGANSRTQMSLNKLNDILRCHYEAGEKDFCIATIGRISKANGGVGTVSIRNQSGKHYRRLIEAWAMKANTSMKKPAAAHSKQREIPSDNKLLDLLNDPALRVLFGQIIAERNILKRENKLMKQQTEIVIDLRPCPRVKAESQTAAQQEKVAVLPSLSGILTPMEIESLKVAVSDDLFERQGWQVNEKTGQVKDEHGKQLYKHGFVNAIKKVLSEV